MMKYHKYDHEYGHVQLELCQIGSYLERKLTQTDVVSFLSSFHAIVPLTSRFRLQLLLASFFKWHTEECNNERKMGLA